MIPDLPSRPIAPGIVLPPIVYQRFVNSLGRDAAEQWLAALPAHLNAWCQWWRIDLEAVDLPDTWNIVLFGNSPEVGEVVVKLGPPSIEAKAEFAALRLAAGSGFVRLIDADPGISLIMLERIRPGSTLLDASLSDDEMTHVGARKMLEFWKDPEPGGDLITLERWARELLDHDPDRHPQAPADLIGIARDIARDLLASPTSRVLLHGDLHHENILRGDGDGWVTIDPKGLVGERGYDIATWMLNPWGIPHREDYVEIASRRLDIFAEMLSEPRLRLAQWAVVHTAMSLCWGLADEHPEDPEGDVASLRSVLRLLG